MMNKQRISARLRLAGRALAGAGRCRGPGVRRDVLGVRRAAGQRQLRERDHDRRRVRIRRTAPPSRRPRRPASRRRRLASPERQHEPDGLVEVGRDVDAAPSRSAARAASRHRRSGSSPARASTASPRSPPTRTPIPSPASRAASSSTPSLGTTYYIQVGVRPAHEPGRVHAHVGARTRSRTTTSRTRPRSTPTRTRCTGWNVGATVQPPDEPERLRAASATPSGTRTRRPSSGSADLSLDTDFPADAQRLHRLVARHAPVRRARLGDGFDVEAGTTYYIQIGTRRRRPRDVPAHVDARRAADQRRLRERGRSLRRGRPSTGARSPRAPSPASRRRSPGTSACRSVWYRWFPGGSGPATVSVDAVQDVPHAPLVQLYETTARRPDLRRPEPGRHPRAGRQRPRRRGARDRRRHEDVLHPGARRLQLRAGRELRLHAVGRSSTTTSSTTPRRSTGTDGVDRRHDRRRHLPRVERARSVGRDRQHGLVRLDGAGERPGDVLRRARTSTRPPPSTPGDGLDNLVAVADDSRLGVALAALHGAGGRDVPHPDRDLRGDPGAVHARLAPHRPAAERRLPGRRARLAVRPLDGNTRNATIQTGLLEPTDVDVGGTPHTGSNSVWYRWSAQRERQRRAHRHAARRDRQPAQGAAPGLLRPVRAGGLRRPDAGGDAPVRRHRRTRASWRAPVVLRPGDVGRHADEPGLRLHARHHVRGAATTTTGPTRRRSRGAAGRTDGSNVRATDEVGELLELPVGPVHDRHDRQDRLVEVGRTLDRGRRLRHERQQLRHGARRLHRLEPGDARSRRRRRRLGHVHPEPRRLPRRGRHDLLPPGRQLRRRGRGRGRPELGADRRSERRLRRRGRRCPATPGACRATADRTWTRPSSRTSPGRRPRSATRSGTRGRRATRARGEVSITTGFVGAVGVYTGGAVDALTPVTSGSDSS